MQITTSTQPQARFFLLSQTHLNLLTACPRKFQHVYLDQLGLPKLPEEEERQVLGTQFHKLMQQRELGLPITELIQAEPQLQRWFNAFTNSPPEMLMGDDLWSEGDYRDSEHQRTLCWHNYVLTGIYDLLILRQQQAQILDWKTYARPQNPQWLQQNWQTRLYPFLLVETSDYRPEQISMTYWFAESQGTEAEPQSLTFAYSSDRHEQTRQDLNQILKSLTSWLQLYWQGNPLPQVPIESGECRHHETNIGNSSESWCRFAIRCQRRLDSLMEGTRSKAISHIQELPLW